MPAPSKATALSAEALLAHRRWLRPLVVALVGEQGADDVLQDTWLAALRRPPQSAAAARSWLARVARRFALRRLDRDERWRRRTRLGAPREPLRSPDELLEQVEAQQRVARAVTELSEPYRSVVLWRYLDELPVEEIAARRGVPASTVRTQLARGLERLRRRLGEDCGPDGQALWALPLLGATEVGTGALRMGTNAKITASVAAALAVCAVLYTAWPQGDAAPPGEPGGVAVPPPASAGLGENAANPAPIERRELAGPGVEQAAAAEAERLARGRVVDARGVVLPGVPLYLAPAAWGPSPDFRRFEPSGEPVATSDGFGAFAVPAVDEPRDVVAGGEFVTLRGAPVDPQHFDAERFLIVAPRVTVEGRVVDDEGLGVEGAVIVATAEPLGAFPESLEPTSIRPAASVRSGKDGAFVHERVPGTADAELRLEKAGYRRARHPCTGRDEQGVVVVMERVAADGSELVGMVLDRAGRAVQGAIVGYGMEQATTGADGIVRLPWQRSGWLRVCAVGFEPFELRRFDQEVWRERGGELPMPIVLDGPARTIAGVVLGADGRPVPGLGLTIADAIMLSGGQCAPEQVAAGKGGHCLDWERTDRDGRFTLGGLGRGDYRLRFFDRDALLSVTTGPIPAGSQDVVVRLPEHAVRRPFTGQVVGKDGVPMMGVRVRVLNQLCQTPDAQLFSAWVVTDAQGRFELPVGPRLEAWLQIEGDEVHPTTEEIGEHAEEDPMVIVASRRCLLRFLAAAGDVDADIVIPRDADGHDVQMLALNQGHPWPHGWWELAKGRSPELTLPDRAVALAYYKAGKLVKTVPLALVPGQVTEVRP